MTSVRRDDETLNDPSPSGPAAAGSGIPLRRRLMFSVVTCCGLWLLMEIALHLAGFSHTSSIEAMVFTFPINEYNTNSESPFLTRDDELFWHPLPNVLGHNSRGMIGPDFDDRKRPGVFRIVCLGDSCTHFGPRSYPEQLQERLDSRFPGRFEVINAACIGYSSHQGLTLLKNDVGNWSPDLVTVYFGWNDHWLARSFRDSQQRPQTATFNAVRDLASRSRTVQLIEWSVSELVKLDRSQPRVELTEYESNLLAMHDLAQTWHAEIWYITAPHAFEFGIPKYLFSSGEIENPYSVARLHGQYNEVTRSVARRANAHCIDLDHKMPLIDKPGLFLDDHIHLSEAGRTDVASRLEAGLEQFGIIDASHDTRP